MDPNDPRGQWQQALAVYVEALAVGRRVAVLGDASMDLGGTLAQLGARAVFVWDPDADRARREAECAPRGVTVRPLPGSDAGIQHGPFDLAIVPDLEIFDDPEDLLERMRRWVGDEGVALVAARNRDAGGHAEGFDYYELFDHVAHQFDDVTMIALLPFHGVALAELGGEDDEAPAVTVDMQLAGADKTPEGFLALASQRGVRLDPYAIVELARPPHPPADIEAVSVESEEAGLRATALEEELERLRARLTQDEQVQRKAESLQEELNERSSRMAEVEATLADRSLRLAALSEEVGRLRARERSAAGQIEELALRAERAERAVGATEPELARLSELHAAELTRYEEALRERAQATRLLEAELNRRERMVRDLVSVLEETAQASAVAPPQGTATSPEQDVLLEENGQLRQKLDALALEVARREGEAQANAWSTAELERRLEAASQPTPAHAEPSTPSNGDDRIDPEVKRRLALALDELDVLRQALAQEHEARLRAEQARQEGGHEATGEGTEP